jgi:hypothetical protein
MLFLLRASIKKVMKHPVHIKLQNLLIHIFTKLLHHTLTISVILKHGTCISSKCPKSDLCSTYCNYVTNQTANTTKNCNKQNLFPLNISSTNLKVPPIKFVFAQKFFASTCAHHRNILIKICVLFMLPCT